MLAFQAIHTVIMQFPMKGGTVVYLSHVVILVVIIVT